MNYRAWLGTYINFFNGSHTKTMSVRLSKSLIIIGVLLALATASFNLHPLRQSHAQDPQTPPTQKIESDDARVVQSGTWSSQAASSASAGRYLFSSGSDADILSLAFEGSALEILYIAGPSLGTLAIEVDGTVLRTIITTDTETRYGQSAKIAYLTDEPHTLKAYAQAGGIIAIDVFVITPAAPSIERVGDNKNLDIQPTNISNCRLALAVLQLIELLAARIFRRMGDLSCFGQVLVIWWQAMTRIHQMCSYGIAKPVPLLDLRFPFRKAQIRESCL
jgi:hypothetical protein